MNDKRGDDQEIGSSQADGGTYASPDHGSTYQANNLSIHVFSACTLAQRLVIDF